MMVGAFALRRITQLWPKKFIRNPHVRKQLATRLETMRIHNRTDGWP
jgi:hypothetical protein